MSKLIIKNVSKIYSSSGKNAKEVTALQPTNLTIAQNDFITILGPSGCGKSTLLRIVAGLEQPTTGSIKLDGAIIDRPSSERGMVFQSYTLFPWLNIEDNIAFGLRQKNMPEKQIKEIVAHYIEQVGLRGFEKHWPKQLSGGMQQRTAIARALANNPKILLLDEPFGALDNQTRGLMQELILDIWEQDQKMVLFVTHDIEEAIFVGKRVVTMSARPGRIKSITDINIPYPRHYKVKSSMAFSAMRAKLTEEIREEAIKVATEY